jgi:hypothetical protein
MVRTILLIVSVFLFLIGCKPTEFAFKDEKIDLNFVKEILTLAKQDSTNQVTGGHIFVAELYDNFIERDGIAEKTIANINSSKQKLDLPVVDKTYELFIITTEGSQKREAIYVPAIFTGVKGTKSHKCIGLGPALVGIYGPGELVFYRKAKYYAKKKKGKIGWVYDKKGSEFKNGSIYDKFDSSKTKFNVLFQTADTSYISDLPQFSITHILQLSDNRFGGKKPLVYNIASVFEDPQALNFIFLRTFKKS